MADVVLREVLDSDLPIFFENQADPESNRLVGFVPRDRAAFDAHWDKIRADPSIVQRTVLLEGKVAGNFVCFDRIGLREVGYWLGREFWGKGVASKGLSLFLSEIPERPLFARVSLVNAASRRVVEKHGFVPHGEDRFLNPAGQQIDGTLYVLRS